VAATCVRKSGGRQAAAACEGGLEVGQRKKICVVNIISGDFKGKRLGITTESFRYNTFSADTFELYKILNIL
jgi:hypothetical protein